MTQSATILEGDAMPADTGHPPRSGRKYWDDYEPTFPPESLIAMDRRRIGRGEMAELVSTIWGKQVTEGTLRYWEDHRWVPLPRREGFPARAVYPVWAAPYLVSVAWKRSQGWGWDAIEADIRAKLVWRIVDANTIGDQVPGQYIRPLQQMAKTNEMITGRQVAGGEITFRDAEGAVTGVLRFDLSDPDLGFVGAPVDVSALIPTENTDGDQEDSNS